MLTFLKLAQEEVNVYVAGFFRFFLGLVIIMPYIIKTNFVVLKTTNISELKSIIRELKGQIGVLSAKIDFIDPNYIPN